MRRISSLAAQLCAVAMCTRLIAPAAAEGGGDMGQGEASIAVRSDVKLGVKGTGGTTSERLGKLGQAVSDQMGEIRACYRKLVATAPEVNGALRLRIGLEEKKKPVVEVVDESASSKELTKCVTHVLATAKYADVGKPAAAMISLEFDNSRARGQAEMVERSAQLAKARTLETPDGMREASWATDAEAVRFTIRVPGNSSESAIDLVLRGLQAGHPAFLDCRRRCGQGDASPEGDIDATLNLDAKGHVRTELGRITVAHQRAPGCAERAFKRVHFDPPGAPLQAFVRVHFAP
jgi:hypothetical protein